MIIKFGNNNKISKSQIHVELNKLSSNSEKLKYILETRCNGYGRILQSKDCKELVKWINDQTPLLQNNFYKIKTKIYWIIYNLHDFPKCEICGNSITKNIFELTIGYGTTVCSKKCKYIKMQHTLQNTLLQKYGVDNISKLAEIKYKKEQTTFKNYNVKNPSQSYIIQQKKIQTNLQLYGETNYTKTIEYKIFLKKYREQKYGKNRALNYTYKYNNIYFDSSWELAFWIYHIDNNINIKREPISFKYFIKNEIHTYYPDFLVNDQLIEIKADRFFNNKNEPIKDGKYPWFEKYNCMCQNNVKILIKKDIKIYLDYIKNKYGKNYLNQFRINIKPCLYV